MPGGLLVTVSARSPASTATVRVYSFEGTHVRLTAPVGPYDTWTVPCAKLALLQTVPDRASRLVGPAGPAGPAGP
jgi:hypothetical protein